MSLFVQIESDWRRASRTGEQAGFFVFWGFTLLAWGGLAAAVPLIVLECLK